jgi:anthranilate 1,2-dioxygenase (deaminating, decarboxylating) small subunit
MAVPTETIEQFLFRAAEYCDSRNWDAYLALYDENCEYHVPQWDSEMRYTRDPHSEMSLIYYNDRSGLEDRVFRLRTNKAASALPPFRTAHMLSNIRPRANADGTCDVKLNWSTHYYRREMGGCFFGWAEYRLRPDGGSWKIMRKHVVLLNDNVSHVLDFYHL